jgi:hypothetical protein
MPQKPAKKVRAVSPPALVVQEVHEEESQVSSVESGDGHFFNWMESNDSTGNRENEENNNHKEKEEVKEVEKPVVSQQQQQCPPPSIITHPTHKARPKTRLQTGRVPLLTLAYAKITLEEQLESEGEAKRKAVCQGGWLGVKFGKDSLCARCECDGH